MSPDLEVKSAFWPDPTFMIRFDVPVFVSFKEIVSEPICPLVKVAVCPTPSKRISSISSKLATDIFVKSVVVTMAIVSVPALEASVMDSPVSTSFVLN